MSTTIYFDMDGTIADLYNVPDWLARLRNEDATPFRVAAPLVNMSAFARLLHSLQKNDIKIGVITWTSMHSSLAFHEAVAKEKMFWLKKHLPSVSWDEIHIIPYGTPKISVAKEQGIAVLFDDNEEIRSNWPGFRFDETRILHILKTWFLH